MVLIDVALKQTPYYSLYLYLGNELIGEARN